MLVAGAGDLVLLFVGLELISIPTYILLYLGRRDAACQESAAKYFFLSVLASAILLYGFSFLYGVGRLDPAWPPSGRRWTARRRLPTGLRGLVEAGDGAGVCRPVLQDRRRAVPFLCPRRVSGHHAPQCGAAVGRAQGGGTGGAGADPRGGHARHGTVRLADRRWWSRS